MVNATWLKAALAVAITLFAVLGMSRLTLHTDLMRALDEQAPAVTAFRDFTEKFGRERDEVLLVEADDLGDQTAFTQLEDLVFELQLSDGIAAVGSIFAVPNSDGSNGLLSQLLAEGQKVAQALGQLRILSPFAQVLVTEDRTGTILTITPEAGTDTTALLATITDAAGFAAPDLSVLPIGVAAMERSVKTGLLFDQRILTPLAGLISLLATGYLFRSWRAGVVCCTPAILGVIWYIGALGWLGIPIDPFIGLVPTVILVLGLADAVHVYFAVGDARRASDDPATAVKTGLRNVFAAIALTSGTTALAFGSLGILGSDVLSTLAWVGALGMALAFAALWLSLPATYAIVRPDTHAALPGFTTFSAMAEWLRHRPVKVTVVGLCLFLAVGAAKLQTQTGFTFDENVPRQGAVRDGFERMAASGLAQDALFIVTPDDSQIGQVTKVLYGASLPSAQVLSAPDGSQAFPLPIALGQGDGRAIIERARALANQLIAAGVNGTETHAFSLLISSEVPRIIQDLRVSFYLSVAVIAGLIAITLGSVRLAALSLIPNLLPIFFVEALLFALDRSVTVAGAVALILAFGIAVDDSAHMLNAYRRAKSAGHSDPIGAALHSKIRPMALTSLLLLAGFALSTFSAMPSIANFGLLVGTSIFVALLTNAFLLPSMLQLWDKRT